MVPKNILRNRIEAGVIMLVLFGLVARLWANEIYSPESGAAAAQARVLHFPLDQSVGVVYLQDKNLVIPETVKGFHSGYTYAERENFSCARGDVHIPVGKRVILTIRGVGARPERYRKALESLGPDDLHGLEF
ncbi:MAG: hypothetical protein ACFFBV_15005, partial [Promethearchaeota archaeon]